MDEERKSFPLEAWGSAEGSLESLLRRVLCGLVPNGKDARTAARQERERVLREQEAFLRKRLPLLAKLLARGEEVDPWRIEPELVLVETPEEKDLVRLLLLAWWSMPPTRAVGRRFALLIRDRQNGKLMGLVSLMSPILGMEARDRYLGITKENRILAVNLGLNGHRVGALPPYNELLGGKLAAMVLASREVREIYKKLYRDKPTEEVAKRVIPPELVYVYTTGAYGRASIYERLRDREGRLLAIHIGETGGYGVMHVSDAVSDLIRKFLESRGIKVAQQYGGSSSRLRMVESACRLLGIPNIAFHGHKRSIYLFPHVSNLREAVAGEEPRYTDRPFEELALWWKERWALPRALRALRKEVDDWRLFTPEAIVRDVIEVLEGDGQASLAPLEVGV